MTIFAIANTAVGSVERVSAKTELRNKRIPSKLIAHVARELLEIIETHYGGHKGDAAKGLGLSAGHLSTLTGPEAQRGESARGPGLPTLLLMRAHTGRSIDSLLGLPEASGAPQNSLLERMSEMQRQIDAIGVALVPRSSIRKKGRG